MSLYLLHLIKSAMHLQDVISYLPIRILSGLFPSLFAVKYVQPSRLRISALPISTPCIWLPGRLRVIGAKEGGYIFKMSDLAPYLLVMEAMNHS